MASPERSGNITAAHTTAYGANRNKRVFAAAGVIALVLLALLAYMLRGHAPVTERTGVPLQHAPVIARTGPVPPGVPQEIIDYLAFLKDIERQRIALAKKHMARAVVISTQVTAGNLTAQMAEEPAQQTNQGAAQFQQLLSEIATEWQQLSAQFKVKEPPPDCRALADAYYEVLRQTTAALSAVGSGMSEAMSGDPGKAVEKLSAMQGSGMGSASGAVSAACKSADDQLGTVCGKFGVRKDFDISDDSSGGSLLSR